MERSVIANVKKASLIEERRERILRASINIFLTKGFHAATTRDVCLAAGITPGTLYNYVRTKSDILYLICDQAISRYHDAVETAIEGVADPRERLIRAIRAVVEAQYLHRRSILVLLREAHALDPAGQKVIRNRVDGFFDRIRGMVAEAAPDRGGNAIPAALLGEFVTYIPTIFAMRPWRLRHELTAEEQINGTFQAILRLLRLDDDRPSAAPTRE